MGHSDRKRLERVEDDAETAWRPLAKLLVAGVEGVECATEDPPK